MRDWFLGDVATEEAADKKKTAFSIGDLTLHDRVGDGHRNREGDVSIILWVSGK